MGRPDSRPNAIDRVRPNSGHFENGASLIESLLNVFWLIVALTTFSLWLLGLRTRRSLTGTRIRMEGVALFCIVVLLLFPISMTDDLHPEVFLAADSSCHWREPWHPLTPATINKSAAAHGGLLVTEEAALPPMVVISALAAQDRVYVKPALESLPQGRSPPTSRA